MKRFALNTASIICGLLIFSTGAAGFKALTADGGPVANLLWDLSYYMPTSK